MKRQSLVATNPPLPIKQSEVQRQVCERTGCLRHQPIDNYSAKAALADQAELGLQCAGDLPFDWLRSVYQKPGNRLIANPNDNAAQLAPRSFPIHNRLFVWGLNKECWAHTRTAPRP